MSAEPSILDYLKSRLAPWRRAPSGASVEQPEQDQPAPKRRAAISVPWLAFTALGLALAAQVSLEPGQDRAWALGSILYCLAAITLGWALARGRLSLAASPASEVCGDRLTVRKLHLALGAVLGLLAFVSFTGNRFTGMNVSLWLLAIAVCVHALWSRIRGATTRSQRLRSLLFSPGWTASLSRWTVAVLSFYLLCGFFRAYRLWDVPPEMTSDHAEQLLSVADVLGGKSSIYFTRYPGREGLLIYLTTLASVGFGTGLSFASLKLVTALCGLFTLPYVYLIGREMLNRNTGLWAMALTGVAYWPNVISRTGQGFTLYPLFVAATLFHLLRGLRRGSPNDFILAGLLLGVGLHGYGSFRVVPIVVILAVSLYLLHAESAQQKRAVIAGLGAVALCALLVFLPLLRFAISNPGVFFFRAATHLTGQDNPLPGPAWQIFLGNLWHALTMCAWDNGEVWVFCVPHRPALDAVSAALFHLGVVLFLGRYLVRRHWLDAFLPLSIPVLMMPSVLSLAFPGENPSLALSAGALVPIFLVAGGALDWLLSTTQSHLRGRMGQIVALALLAVLLTVASLQNYGLVFDQYVTTYRLSSWNASEMGHVIKAFSESLGNPDSAWVVSYPHWVDTRLVGFEAGYPDRDYAIRPENFPDTLADRRAKVFLLKPGDKTSVDLLRTLYPNGELRVRRSRSATKDFLIFWVPPRPLLP